MPTPPLVDPTDLDEFPGAPWNATLVDVASAGLRASAGWHIAPEVTETLTVYSDGGTRLMLPTLRLVSVTEVRHLPADADPVVLSGWHMRRAGYLIRGHCWPWGTLEVDLTHGYEECPAELLPLVVEGIRSHGRDRQVASQASGPFSITYRDAGTADVPPALARYALPSRP